MKNLLFLFFLTLIVAAPAAAQEFDAITNIIFEDRVIADQGLFNNITGSTVSATTVAAGSLTAGDVTASGDISADAVSAATGTFTEIILGGGNIEDALFPLTKDADLGGFSLTNGATVQAVTGKFDQVILGGGNLEEALFPLTTNANFNGFNLVNGGNIDADSLEFDGGTGTLNSVTIEDGTASFSSIFFAAGTGTLDTVTVSGGTGTFDGVNATVLDATSSTLDTVTVSGGTGTLNSLTVLDSSSFGGSFTVGGDMTVESNLTVNQSFSAPTALFANVETDFLELDGPFIFSAVDWIHYASLENTNNFLYADGGYFSNQIVRLDGVLWQAGKDLPNADYFPWNTNCVDGTGPCAYPVPGIPVGDSTNWVPVSKGLDGDDGARGLPGQDGLDGVGNMQYGIFDSTRTYIYDTNTPIVVSHNGRWYDLIQSVTNYPSPAPDSEPGPIYWSISVEKGLDGEIIGSSNLVYRGGWDSGVANYTTNDVVQYEGNLFTVDPTNQVPSLGTAPAVGADKLGQNSAYWTLHVSRGLRGATGSSGQDGIDGSSVSNFTYYYISTNPPPLHQQNGPNPGPTNRIYQWHSVTNGTNFYRWDGIVPVSSNYLEDVDGVLHYVVGSNSTPVGNGSGNASLTSAWSVVYSDAATNPVPLALGTSNTFLKSTGPSSAPIWAEATDAATVSNIAQTVVASSNLLSVSEAASLYRENVNATTANVLQVVFADGTTQTTAGVSGNTTVTNLPDDLAYIDISNNWTAAQSLPANSTVGGGEFGNVITPVTVSTNVSGTWTIELSSDTPVGIYHQIGNITNVLFDVDSTNDMILGQVLLLATTNAITWPTNNLVWASGSGPSVVDGEYNKLYFESWRGKTFGVYMGSVP
jgi:hypothetical protein